MSCITCTLVDADDAITKTIFYDFEVREWVKIELIENGKELYCIDKGTVFSPGKVSQDKGAITSDSHRTNSGTHDYYTGSIGYNLNITYIGIHQCLDCKRYWWVEFKKKNDLHILDYVGPYQDPVMQHFDLEAIIHAEHIDKEIPPAITNFTLDNYYTIASKTNFFERFYDVHLSYFEAIVKKEKEAMIGFFGSEKYKEISTQFFIRNEWEEFMKKNSRGKK